MKSIGRYHYCEVLQYFIGICNFLKFSVNFRVYQSLRANEDFSSCRQVAGAIEGQKSGFECFKLRS